MRRKEGKWGKANAPQTGSRKEPCYAPYTFCYRGQSAKTNNKKRENEVLVSVSQCSSETLR